MSVTNVQHVYFRHAYTCITPASGVLTEDMLTPAVYMIMPELNMLTPVFPFLKQIISTAYGAQFFFVIFAFRRCDGSVALKTFEF